MKRIWLWLSVFFTVLTLAGSWYVLSADGQVNPGYAVVPLAFAVAFLSIHRIKSGNRQK